MALSIDPRAAAEESANKNRARMLVLVLAALMLAAILSGFVLNVIESNLAP